MNIKEYRYDGSSKLNLKEAPTCAEPSAKKKDCVARTEANLAQCAILQEKLCAAGLEGLIIAIQARDAAGKDSLIKKVFGKLNPAALEVHSFKAPSKEELSHDYLWRLNQRLPARGKIGVFNRSHYEDVLVARVHQLEKGYAMPARVTGDKDFYRKRYAQQRDLSADNSLIGIPRRVGIGPLAGGGQIHPICHKKPPFRFCSKPSSNSSCL